MHCRFIVPFSMSSFTTSCCPQTGSAHTATAKQEVAGASPESGAVFVATLSQQFLHGVTEDAALRRDHVPVRQPPVRKWHHLAPFPVAGLVWRSHWHT